MTLTYATMDLTMRMVYNAAYVDYLDFIAAHRALDMADFRHAHVTAAMSTVEKAEYIAMMDAEYHAEYSPSRES